MTELEQLKARLKQVEAERDAAVEEAAKELENKVEAVKRRDKALAERDEWKGRADQRNGKLANYLSLEPKLTEALALLKMHMYQQGEGGIYCNYCAWEKKRGHAPDCRLSKLLKGSND